MPSAVPKEMPWPTENSRGYKIPEQVYGTLKPIKVIAIGAGISGISLAHDVQENGENIDLTIYEMGPSVGGTWFWNSYPGCRCDIPAVNYTFSWSPKADWSEFYASSPEICEHFQDVVDKYGLMKYIHLQHEVVRAEWFDDVKKWQIVVRGPDGSLFDDECDVFINGGGILNTWKWPAIEGLHDFKGTLCHTARWPKNLDITGKRVAVLGSGSSGIQLLASIQPKAGHIHHWIRSPTWITSAFAQQYAGPGGRNFSYTEDQKNVFADDPEHYLKYRKMIESELNQRFKFVVLGTPEQEAALAYATKHMHDILDGNERLKNAIIPKTFSVGCRRPTPGNGYLEALLQPNVQVYTDMLQRITERGFIDADGVEHEVDVFICATGFDTSYRPRFPVFANGVNLQDKWRTYPNDAYMSIAVKDFPNYFTYFGPHGPAGHGSTVPLIEAYTKCFLRVLKKMQTENITTMSIRPRACDDFNEHRELYLKRTAWSGNCSSWFKPGNKNASPAMFPGNRILMIEMLNNFRWEDWDYEYGYAGNRFGYWGNGFTSRELDGRDTTFYYGLLNGKDEQPDYSDIRPLYTSSS
ncbi:FAD/NAD-P-binding domain-containing protein [Stereum hirsutum FP-91666 SS1]|uniref:FAD/NAD-P-binding domain-containing protein n=1 Tax=Stereum hirsutum (strain FP-91666) TaxID=721885 RepID=UPI0004410669|nr:FAD/NAD-P-binding domain-containing protein [Stereum hirsutum FP-91666 SS1]EIM90702.1 FAD/NAD-P-binding domain-containing protein [Stereum hirsutum FP-91666 SS1]